MRTHRRRHRPAFTILELVLVIALAVILAAIAAPSLERLYGDVRLSAASDLVRARWADCRASAMDQGQPYRFAIRPGSGAFRIAPDRGDFWEDGSGMGDQFDDPEAKPLIIEQNLPDNVTFSGGDGGGGGDWQRIGTFLPDGTCRENISIVFQMPGQPSLRLSLRGMTGTVRVESIPEDAP